MQVTIEVSAGTEQQLDQVGAMFNKGSREDAAKLTLEQGAMFIEALNAPDTRDFLGFVSALCETRSHVESELGKEEKSHAVAMRLG